MRIQRIEEFQINESVHQQINVLLNKTFGDYYQEKSYYKQIPTFRYLVWQGEDLIGHMGIEHRKINVGEILSSIFGVVDLCIHDSFQSKNIASSLLKELELLGKKHQIDFLVLVAQNHEVYEKNGFSLVTNTCRWLMINGNQTLGVGHRRIEECLMMKAINDKKWNNGLIDFFRPYLLTHPSFSTNTLQNCRSIYINFTYGILSLEIDLSNFKTYEN